jgi:hypothetical protein
VKTKKCFVSIYGCHDSTSGEFEFTEEQFEFLKKFVTEFNKGSTYRCQPTIELEEVEG